MSKKQWIGLLVLVLLVTAVELCAHFTRRWRDRQTASELLTILPERNDDFLRYLDSLDKAEYAARRAQYASYRYTPSAVRLQPFDPNTADSTLLVTVGLKPWMAHNLIRYRNAGKVFRQPDDLRRLYGMTDSLYTTLAPYIQFDPTNVDSLSGRHRAIVGSISGAPSLFSSSNAVKRDTILDLNTADTAELQLLHGIGRFTAVQIVRYRQELGGYYSPDQLYEIKELPTARVDSILPHLFADTALITPIDVNRASVRQLYRHRYISYPQAQQLYDLRRRRVRLNSLSDLAPVFTDDERRRLAPYLRFDDR